MGGLQGAHERLTHTASELEVAREDAYQAGLTAGRIEGEGVGHGRGLGEGIEKGRSQEQTRLRSESEALEIIVSEVLEERTRLLNSAGQALVDLVMEIARRVVRRALSCDSEVAMRVIQDTLGYVEGSQQIVIRVNPIDAENVQPRMEEVRATLGTGAHMQLRADPAVARGGCRMDTPDLQFDATLEGHLDRFSVALTGWAGQVITDEQEHDASA